MGKDYPAVSRAEERLISFTCLKVGAGTGREGMKFNPRSIQFSNRSNYGMDRRPGKSSVGIGHDPLRFSVTSWPMSPRRRCSVHLHKQPPVSG